MANKQNENLTMTKDQTRDIATALEVQGFYTFDTDADTGITPLIVPLNMTARPMIGKLTVCLPDRDGLTDVRDALREVPRAVVPGGLYMVEIAVYISSEDERTTLDGLFSLEAIPALLRVFEEHEMVLKWAEN